MSSWKMKFDVSKLTNLSLTSCLGAEKTTLWHHQRARRHPPHQEEIQKQHPMDVSVHSLIITRYHETFTASSGKKDISIIVCFLKFNMFRILTFWLRLFFENTDISNSSKTKQQKTIKQENRLLLKVEPPYLLPFFHRGCSLLEEEGSLSQRQRLTDEVSALGEEEQRLEQLIQRCSTDMRHMSELSSNQKYPFVPTWQIPRNKPAWYTVLYRSEVLHITGQGQAMKL